MKHLWIVAAVLAGAAFLWRQPPKPPAPIAMATQSPHSVRRIGDTQSVLVVYVAGAVKRPALYRLRAGSRAADAVRAAGGFRADAADAATNLAERLSDGVEVRVYSKSEKAKTSRSPRSGRSRTHKAAAPALVTDINTADAQTLAALPGIGATLAQRIVAFRELNGDFASVDELLDVAGMTQRRLDMLAPYLQVHGAQ